MTIKINKINKKEKVINRHKILEICEKITALMFKQDGTVREKIVFFVGAGCSREYGIPTTMELAFQYLKSDKGGLSKEEKTKLTELKAQEIFELFVKKYHKENTPEIAYGFFKEIVNRGMEKEESKSLTYETLVNLWENNYVDIVFTTNFDNLIEEKISKPYRVLDYQKLQIQKFPRSPDALTLVKLAGDIETSNMLWTEEEFSRELNDTVIKWIEEKIWDKPVILMGYKAAEAEIMRLLLSHPRELFIIINNELETVSSLDAISKYKKGKAFYLKACCCDFLNELNEKIYQKTQNIRLTYSFSAIKERLAAIFETHIPLPDEKFMVKRKKIENAVSKYLKKDKANRVVVLYGESGYGKTYYLQHMCRQYNQIDEDGVYVYIKGTELNDSLKSWFSRVENFDIDSIFNTVKTLGKKIILAVDGLNECSNALAVLNDVTAILDRYRYSKIKFILSVRAEFWNNNKNRLSRIFYHNEILMDKYDSQECIAGLRKYGVKFENKFIRRSSIIELISIPIYQRFIFETGVTNLEAVTFHSIFEQYLKRKITWDKDYYKVVFKFCELSHQSKSVFVQDFPEKLSYDKIKKFRELDEQKILVENKINRTYFEHDKLGEYVFGKIYLYEFLFKESTSPLSASHFLRRLIDEFKEIPDENLAYKVFFLNSIKFFIMQLSCKEISVLFSTKNLNIISIAKEALYEKKYLEFQPDYKNDYFLIAVSMQNAANYDQILAELLKSPERLNSHLLFNSVAKIFPESLFDFINFLISQLKIKTVTPRKQDRLADILLQALLIFYLKNGIKTSPENRKLVKKLLRMASMFESNYLNLKIKNLFQNNKSYLLYSEESADKNDLFHLEKSFKENLLKAIDYSIFSIPHHSIEALIKRNISSWLIVIFLMLRDYRHERFEQTIETLFSTGSLRLQDFVLTLLGHLSKLDESYAELLLRYTLEMKKIYPENFYKLDISGTNPDSQYDPLTPYISTILHHNGRIPLEELGYDDEPKYKERLVRFLYKITPEFPREVLECVYQMDESGYIPLIKLENAVKTIKTFYPETFWDVTKSFRLSEIFRLDMDAWQYEKKSVSQLRDWEWFNILSFFLSSEKNTKLAEYYLKEIIVSESIQQFLSEHIDLKRIKGIINRV